MKLFLACGALATSAVAATDTWNVIKGNACGTLKGCSCTDGCKDTPNLHYAGNFSSRDDCAATCSSAGSANCSIWLYSEHSKHCFWRLDGVWEPNSDDWVDSGCIEASDDPSFKCVPGCGSCGAAPAPAPKAKNYTNMNGMYNLSNVPGSDVSKFPTNYRDYPGQPDYFEVYSPPITSLYSQVFWTRLPTVDLPQHIVQRFKDKTMAVVGFEMDQVRRTPDGDVSIPINVAYNHHFESTMTGNGATWQRIEVEGPDDPRLPEASDMGHRRPNESEAWIVVTDPEREAMANGIPSSTSFGAANGGEYRKSFHGYAPGYAQLIHSPEAFSITPMQIDTWNRDKMSITGGPFVPGPVPRTSLAPVSGPDALYSGLLECPVTTRLRKELKGGAYEVQVQDTCNTSITSAQECFQAATQVHFPSTANLTYSTTSLPSSPPGCVATVTGYQGDNASIAVVYNTATNTTATCGAASGDPADLVAYGTTSSLVELAVKIDTPNDLVTINMTGPSDVWFGVGFNATQMKDSPWAIIVEPSTTTTTTTATVTERKLVDQGPGTQLSSSIKVVSDTVSGNLRTIVATRGLKGATSDHFTFDAAKDTSLNFINAVGSGPKLAYHKDKTASSISILPVGSDGDSLCICAVKPPAFGQGVGTFVYQDGSSVGCCNHCSEEPRSDMMAMKNPTCDLRTYVGGQLSCHHMWSLLDADQDIPWQDQPLNYSLKFRFWFEEYNATGGAVAESAQHEDAAQPSHQEIGRTTWGIASPVEYDVPKCDNQTMGCAQSADGNWVHTIKGTFEPSPSGISLVAAHFHCHAPTCLSVALYNNKTGELICEEKPIYGGHGEQEAKFDEPGYITQPPCLWGDEKYGLTPPVNLDGVTLHAVKTSNATYGHHGEMAWLQMFYIKH